MPQISLACYSVRFRKRYSRDFIDLSDPELKDVFTFISAFFNSHIDAGLNNADIKKLLRIRQVSSVPPNIEGVLLTGEYGYESELVDVTKQQAPYRRTKTQADMLPFYFTLYFPSRGECGILILQRFGLFGVRTILAKSLQDEFQKRFSNITMHIWPQVPDGVINELFGGGEIRKITLRKIGIPEDLADSVLIGKRAAKDINVDMVIRATHGTAFGALRGRIQKMLKSEREGGLNEVVEYADFKYDKILVEVDLGGNKRTVDLSDLNKLRAYIDVTEQITTGDDGHPTFRSLSSESTKLMSGLRQMLQV